MLLPHSDNLPERNDSSASQKLYFSPFFFLCCDSSLPWQKMAVISPIWFSVYLPASLGDYWSQDKEEKKYAEKGFPVEMA